MSDSPKVMVEHYRNEKREQILAMEGTQLKDAVCEHVFGWTHQELDNGYNYLAPYWVDADGNKVKPYNFFDPHLRIEHAWEVVEKMKTNDWVFNINSIDDEWTALFHLDMAHEYEVTCKSAPEAISKAALLAVMNL